MTPQNHQLTIREARRTISRIMNAGGTVTIGGKYGTLRGFIVGVPAHNHYDQAKKRKALKAAKAAFQAAWIAEWSR